MKKTTFFIAATISSILFSSFNGCRHHMTAMCGPKVLKDQINTVTKQLSKELDLHEEQRSHMNTIKDEIIAKFSEKKKHKAELFTVIQEETQKESIDQTRLQKIFDDNKQFRDDMHKFMLNKLTEFHAMLTKEQRTKLKSLLEKMKDKFDEE